MPELAEVEFNRKRWDPGIGQKVLRVALHGTKRVFRGEKLELLQKKLPGSTLKGSEARAKQMLFHFSGGLWIGIHLGMTGGLRVEPADFEPGKHDHLVLFQKRQALIFSDPRQFGRIRVAESRAEPEWWASLPPEVLSREWTEERLQSFLKRRARLAVKAALLVQSAFPGVGNWMADEILWHARVNPKTLCGDLSHAQISALWRESRNICRTAMKTVGVTYEDPPEDWLFHERWKKDGHCPRHGTELQTATVGGRTTRWCAKCQGRS